MWTRRVLVGLAVGGLGALALIALPGPRAARAASPSPSETSAAVPSILASPQISPPPNAQQMGSDSCTVCHGNPAIVTQNGDRSLYVTQQMLTSSVHSSLDCLSCHRTLAGDLHSNAKADLAAAQASCAKCHESEAAQYLSSAHGPKWPMKTSTDEGTAPTEKPTCVTCHGSHLIQPATTRTFAVQTAQLCSDCHTENGASYYDYNYHGKETALGRYDVAVCSDCHTAHHELPPSDPASSVSQQNVVATCAKCHPGAPANFAGIIIHVGGEPLPSDPKLRIATLYMLAVLIGSFTFFGMHTVLGIRHRARMARAAAGGQPGDEGGATDG
jgi:hypothetical protein